MWSRLRRGWPLLVAALVGGVFVAVVEAVYGWLHSGTGSDVLAMVDGKPITVQAFRNEVTHRGGDAAFTGSDQRRALLDEMIRIAVLAANAQKVGYTDDIEIRRGVQQMMADKYQRDNIDVPLADLKPSDGDVEDYYRAHASAFTTPEAKHAALIMVAVPATASEDERRTLQQRAQRIRDLVVAKGNTRSFAEIASEYSDDAATRGQGGDLGWIEVGRDVSRWDPAVTSALSPRWSALSEIQETSSPSDATAENDARPREVSK